MMHTESRLFRKPLNNIHLPRKITDLLYTYFGLYFQCSAILIFKPELHRHSRWTVLVFSLVQDMDYAAAWCKSNDLDNRRQVTKPLNGHQPILDWVSQAFFGIYSAKIYLY